MEKQDRIDILTKLENYASSLKDEKKAQQYGILLEVFIEVLNSCTRKRVV